MDCNSFSYAPTMLDAPENTLNSYKNDDMEIELTHDGPGCFTVWAFSYDGDLDVFEEFPELEPAQKLYDFICENYTASPPGPELTAFIEALPDRHGGTI